MMTMMFEPSRPSGDCPCLGYRKPGQPYQWISYTEVWHVLMFHPQHFSFVCLPLLFVDWTSPTPQVAEKAQLLGSGLLAKGCQPNPQQFVGIFAPNRPEVWTVSFFFIFFYFNVVFCSHSGWFPVSFRIGEMTFKTWMDPTSSQDFLIIKILRHLVQNCGLNLKE